MTDSAVTADFFEVQASSREQAVCEKISSFYEEGKRLYVLADSEASARRIDELLWTFRDNSFVPHSLWGGGETPLTDQVAVGWRSGNPNGAEKLVLAGNIETAGVLAARSSFSSIADFVPKGDNHSTAAARERFKTLRDAGVEPVYHPIGA